MLAATRTGSIVDLAILQPIRWLAGKTSKLADQGWTVACMSKAVIALEGALEKVVEDGPLLLKESFILYIFEGIAVELDESMNLAARQRSIETGVNFCAPSCSTPLCPPPSHPVHHRLSLLSGCPPSLIHSVNLAQITWRAHS
jgi:hypothetical protein